MTMKGYLTADDIANQVRFLRTQFKGTFLIVEGDTDSRVYKNFIDEAQCQTVVANGKSNATLALEKLEQNQFSGAIAIIDADFARINGEKFSSDHLFLTDFHDLETMIFMSPALGKVLREFGSDEKIAVFFSKYGVDVRTALFSNAAHIGIFRLISLNENLHLEFEDLSYSNFVDQNSLRVDLRELIRSVKNKSQKHQLDTEALIEKIQQISRQSFDPREICCGHDLSHILSIALKRAIGTMNTGDAKSEILERSLRLAYEYLHFSNSQLHARLKEWETSQNGAFRIFENVG